MRRARVGSSSVPPITTPRADSSSYASRAIFDVDNLLRVFEYSPNLWPSTVHADLPRLTEHIKAAWAARDSNNSFMKILRGKKPV
jgi:hypothetical protein